MPPPLLITVADNWSTECELSFSLCSSHIDPKSRLVIRLENIEENAQSYVNTGQIHASCDVRHIVEIAFAWTIVDIYFCVRRAFVADDIPHDEAPAEVPPAFTPVVEVEKMKVAEANEVA
ncbi:uncharacterized protein LOC114316625 [Camellia sinensis]|uniref:uncharacterized protein LOC114316625 n=1 Tax=Camellia sinensis TaxID=4442 RepID=UPI001035DB5F|nr:uncharacterized protein LOC114316625 [Camellia sinensis]